MTCQNCGTEFNGDICPKCRAQTTHPQRNQSTGQQDIPTPLYGQTVYPPPKKRLKWWELLLIILGAVFALLLFTGIIEHSTESDPETHVPTPAESEHSTVEGSGDIGNYYIEIVSAKKGQDYSCKDVLIVTYKWTNNSNKDQMFSTAFSAKAYQNGVECSSLTIVDGVDSHKPLSNIKPGTSLEVQKAYLLDGDSDVVIEVGPWISLGNERKVVKTFSLK